MVGVHLNFQLWVCHLPSDRRQGKMTPEKFAAMKLTFTLPAISANSPMAKFSFLLFSACWFHGCLCATVGHVANEPTNTEFITTSISLTAETTSTPDPLNLTSSLGGSLSNAPVPNQLSLYAIDGDTLDHLFAQYISNVLLTKQQQQQNFPVPTVVDIRKNPNLQNMVSSPHEKSVILLKGSHSQLVINGNLVQYIYNVDNSKCNLAHVSPGNLPTSNMPVVTSHSPVSTSTASHLYPTLKTFTTLTSTAFPESSSGLPLTSVSTEPPTVHTSVSVTEPSTETNSPFMATTKVSSSILEKTSQLVPDASSGGPVVNENSTWPFVPSPFPVQVTTVPSFVSTASSSPGRQLLSKIRPVESISTKENTVPSVTRPSIVSGVPLIRIKSTFNTGHPLPSTSPTTTTVAPLPDHLTTITLNLGRPFTSTFTPLNSLKASSSVGDGSTPTNPSTSFSVSSTRDNLWQTRVTRRSTGPIISTLTSSRPTTEIYSTTFTSPSSKNTLGDSPTVNSSTSTFLPIGTGVNDLNTKIITNTESSRPTTTIGHSSSFDAETSISPVSNKNIITNAESIKTIENIMDTGKATESTLLPPIVTDLPKLSTSLLPIATLTTAVNELTTEGEFTPSGVTLPNGPWVTKPNSTNTATSFELSQSSTMVSSSLASTSFIGNFTVQPIKWSASPATFSLENVTTTKGESSLSEITLSNSWTTNATNTATAFVLNQPSTTVSSSLAFTSPTANTTEQLTKWTLFPTTTSLENVTTAHLTSSVSIPFQRTTLAELPSDSIFENTIQLGLNKSTVSLSSTVKPSTENIDIWKTTRKPTTTSESLLKLDNSTSRATSSSATKAQTESPTKWSAQTNTGTSTLAISTLPTNLPVSEVASKQTAALSTKTTTVTTSTTASSTTQRPVSTSTASGKTKNRVSTTKKPVLRVTRFPSPIVSWHRNHSSTPSTIPVAKLSTRVRPKPTTTRFVPTRFLRPLVPTSASLPSTIRTRLPLDEFYEIKRKFFENKRNFFSNLNRILSVPTTTSTTRRPIQHLFPSFAKWIQGNTGR